MLELRQTFALFRFVPLAQAGKKYANSGPGFSNPALGELVRQISSCTRFSLLDEDSLIDDWAQPVLYGSGTFSQTWTQVRDGEFISRYCENIILIQK